MLTTYEKRSRTKLVAMLATVLVIAGLVVLADHLKSQSATNATQMGAASSTTTPASTTSSVASTANTGSYKDGTYTASSDYSVPHSDESIQVNLTLKSGIVSSVSVKNSETDGTSAEFQEEFAAAYKSYVVGKQISGLKLSVIAGASDTTQGFNDALSQIASKAQS
jgi:uncharacterized protein with FMN-binding domain